MWRASTAPTRFQATSTSVPSALPSSPFWSARLQSRRTCPPWTACTEHRVTPAGLFATGNLAASASSLRCLPLARTVCLSATDMHGQQLCAWRGMRSTAVFPAPQPHQVSRPSRDKSRSPPATCRPDTQLPKGTTCPIAASAVSTVRSACRWAAVLSGLRACTFAGGGDTHVAYQAARHSLQRTWQGTRAA